ncbi:MAG: zinc-binding alcohol dehydrogenase [Synergistales bacterium]|nr:zinc-binding alcohol dehydrogenase [Synergistales bacterium]
MKSVYVYFPEPNKVNVGEEEVSAPREGEILCQAEKSLISIGTETYCLRGVFDPGTNWASWVKYPFRPGYSMVGRVIDVGPGVKGCRVGDRVLASAPHQQFFKTTPERINLVPESLSSEEATWGTLACTTQLAVRRAELALGETVGVVGLGMLGQLVVQYLWVAGARKIIAVDTIQSRLEVAKAHGATHVLNNTAEGARPQIAEITEGRMLDAVWDVTGHPSALAQCIQLLRKRGRVILTGDTPTPTQQHLGPGVVSNSISILGIHGSSSAPYFSEFTPWTRQEIIALFFDYVMQKRMCVDDLITHRHNPVEAPQVYERLIVNRSSSIGVIFDWDRIK